MSITWEGGAITWADVDHLGRYILGRATQPGPDR